MDNSKPDAFIFMKVGSHEGECLDCIVKRKLLELNGLEERIFWGYGMNSLLPKRVQCFARQRGNGEGPVKLLMALTRKEEQVHSLREKNPEATNHQCQPKLHCRAKKYSEDEKKWEQVDKNINVPGSKYALVLDEIEPVNLKFDRQQFKVGIGPSEGCSAAKYGGNRIDQVCLVKAGSMRQAPFAPKIVTVTYQAHLEYPYAVYLR